MTPIVVVSWRKSLSVLERGTFDQMRSSHSGAAVASRQSGRGEISIARHIAAVVAR